MPENENQSSLVQKIAEACDAVGGVEKKGRNKEQGYTYQRATDVAKAIRHELFERGIVILQDEGTPAFEPFETKSGSKQIECRLPITYRIMGYGTEIAVVGWGVGRDSGDKAIWKAKTGALKYFLRALGLIPDEKEDPEYDGRGRDEEEEGDDPRVEIAGLIAQETESEESRWILIVDKDKKQIPVKMDKRSALSKRLLVGYEAVIKAIPFEKDGKTAYSLTDVLWMDKTPVQVGEAPKQAPSPKKAASTKPAVMKAGEATIGTGQMNIQLQQARKRTSIPDSDYYAILHHEAGVDHGPDIPVVKYPQVFKAVSEYKLAVNNGDEAWVEGRE